MNYLDALGTDAIYTDSVKGAHIIHKVMLRITPWMHTSYLIDIIKCLAPEQQGGRL